MALNVCEGLLNDSEESCFNGLRHAIELRQDEQLSVNTTAIGEALNVLF